MYKVIRRHFLMVHTILVASLERRRRENKFLQRKRFTTYMFGSYIDFSEKNDLRRF
jgi:hypothetical protein